MNRRDFLKTCSMGVAATALPQFLAYADVLEFNKVTLTDMDGKPIKSEQIQSKTEYLFQYPYQSTPCFLIDLGSPLKTEGELPTSEGTNYQWLGGVGPNQSVVAFVAICQHQLQYPNKALSMMNYNPDKSDVAGGVGQIVCCAHNSVYDPAQGGKVTKGPASNPLMAVRLEWDEKTDTYAANGIYGHDILKDFFKAYKRKLKKEYGRRAYKQLVEKQAPLVLGSKYSQMQVMC